MSRESARAWRAAHRERAIERDRARYAAKREELCAAQRARRNEDPAVRARAAERSAAWKAAHPEQTREHYCRWRLADPQRAAAKERRRDERVRLATVERVERGVVWSRESGTCHLCGRAADPADWHLEHVVPIAAGGEHSYANVRVAHPVCNLRKGAA